MANKFLELEKPNFNEIVKTEIYTVPLAKSNVFIGLSLANVGTTAIKATVWRNGGRLCHNAPIAAGGALTLAGEDQKIVLVAESKLYVSVTGEVDIMGSYLETDDE